MGLEVMLRVYFLRQLVGLSAARLEETFYESA